MHPDHWTVPLLGSHRPAPLPRTPEDHLDPPPLFAFPNDPCRLNPIIARRRNEYIGTQPRRPSCPHSTKQEPTLLPAEPLNASATAQCNSPAPVCSVRRRTVPRLSRYYEQLSKAASTTSTPATSTGPM